MNRFTRSRKSIRLRGYDYSQAGAYFVTLCAYQMKYLFGEIINGMMKLNTFGEIAYQEWFRTAKIRTDVQLFNDELVVMPNHIQGIIWIIDERATQRVAPTKHSHGPQPDSLSAIIGQYKSITTKNINKIQKTMKGSVWQRNYYDHIIRSDNELKSIRQYIQTNPQNWEKDQDIPFNLFDFT